MARITVAPPRTMSPPAKTPGMLVAIVGLFEALFTLLLTLSWEYAIVSAIFPGLVLWYLGREKIKAAFGVEDESA